ncbi:MAG: DoxX family protein [Tannerellaceae bacterium]|nr:DoxX family protein [Tannerellaceae bacterium]
MSHKDLFFKILTECCRVLVGVTFIFSGFVKAVDPVGGAIKIDEYFASFGLDVLQPLSLLSAINLSAVEFTLGVCLLLGVYRKFTTFLIALFMVFMTPLTLYLAIFNPVSDCGCFGEALVITNWQTFFKNVVLLAAAILLFIRHKQITSFFSNKAYWFVALFAYLFCVAFAYRNYHHLPAFDFRPYKTGNNIPELMEIPDGAPEDEYVYSFIYEKDGVQKEFTLEDYPANDSTWTFVDSKMLLIKEGYTPVIETFNLYTPEGEDITDEILYAVQPVFLLISHKLEKADPERIDEINSLYDYAVDHDILFYGVTGSSAEGIEDWRDYTGADYPFLLGDDILLKTIIRSNPGLVLLKEGTVLGKWHYNDIPKEQKIEETISPLLNKGAENNKEQRRIVTILLTFSLPLLVVWLYDYLRNRRSKKENGKEEAEPLGKEK